MTDTTPKRPTKFDVTEKVTLRTALHELNLTERFQAFCQQNATDAQILQWIKKRPELYARAFLPTSFHHVRKVLDCKAKPGGPRPPGRKLYTVQGLR